MRDKNRMDEDLFEDFAEGELEKLALQAKEDMQHKKQLTKNESKTRRPFPKWAFWLIAIFMILQVAAFLPKTITLPAIDFLTTSAKLSSHHDIQTYKKAIVAIEASDKKGTGFVMDSSGTILTNFHVIDGNEQVTVAIKNEGLFTAKVVEQFPDIDVAVLKIEQDEPGNFSHLQIAAKNQPVTKGENMYLIGNPLGFIRIANKGTLLGTTRLADWQDDVYMIDAPIYHGNSGSPVINMEGKVIGIVFATIDDDKHGKTGLAIPISAYLERK